MKFNDEMLLANSKLNDVVELSIGKVKVVEGGDCEGCIVETTKDKNYKIGCHHYCTTNKNRPFVKFIKEQ